MFGKLVQTNYHTIFVITKVSFNYHCHYHPIGINDIGRHIIVNNMKEYSYKEISTSTTIQHLSSPYVFEVDIHFIIFILASTNLSYYNT